MNRSWLRNRAVRRAAVLLTVAVFAFFFHIPPFSKDQVIATRVSLVVVNATVQEQETGKPVTDLGSQDFLVFDNGHPAETAIFVGAASRDRQPVTIWFLLRCPGRNRINRGSRFIVRKSQLFRPMLDSLRSEDTVGVAHWCGNGDAKIDLAPTPDREGPLPAIDAILHQSSTKPAKLAEEKALLQTLDLIVDSPHSRSYPPVILLLYDGGVDMQKDEAEVLAKRVTYKGAALYQITAEPPGSALHFITKESGGRVVRVRHDDYAEAVKHVFDALQCRYTLGVVPRSNDGQWHQLQVQLTQSALAKHSPVNVEYEAGYLAVDSIGSTPPYSISKYQEQGASRLDPELIAAIDSPTLSRTVHFDANAHGFLGEPYLAEFALKIDSDEISWGSLPNGDRQSTISIVVASFSEEGKRLDEKIVQFGINRDEIHLPITGDGPFAYSYTVTFPANATRIRLAVCDTSTGHVGVRDFTINEIMAAPKTPLLLK